MAFLRGCHLNILLETRLESGAVKYNTLQATSTTKQRVLSLCEKWKRVAVRGRSTNAMDCKSSGERLIPGQAG